MTILDSKIVIFYVEYYSSKKSIYIQPEKALQQ